MNRAALLIGGNQGDRRELIEQATELIRQRIGSVVALSGVYETAPWGDFADEGRGGTAPFLNRALVVETTMDAHETLHAAQAIEALLGRMRKAKALEGESRQRVYHSRTMDIDIIFWNEEVIETADLTVPHPRMHQRRFVLEPLAEIIPDYRHPVLGKSVRELLMELPE